MAEKRGKILTIRAEEEMHNKLQELADEIGVKKSTYAYMLIKKALKEKN